MTHDHPANLHPICPTCHLSIRDGESSIMHEGRSYHRRCAPKPEIAGDKDNATPGLISI